MDELSFLRFETQSLPNTSSNYPSSSRVRLGAPPLVETQIPLYQVGDKEIGMKVSAACVAIDYTIGLVFWAEPLKDGNEIYPLDDWSSDPTNLDFDFCKPLKEWERKGLKHLSLAHSNQLPQSEQTGYNHPLHSIAKGEGLNLTLNTVTFHEYQGLTSLSKLSKAGRIKGEYYPRYEKTIARVKRMEPGKPDPIALAFLCAMSIIGEEKPPPRRYPTARSRCNWA